MMTQILLPSCKLKLVWNSMPVYAGEIQNVLDCG